MNLPLQNGHIFFWDSSFVLRCKVLYNSFHFEAKNLFPSGVHIRETSPIYNTTLLDPVLILLETFLVTEVHMPPVWILIAVS